MSRATLSHSGYDILTCHVLLSHVGMASLQVMLVYNYTAVDVMIVSNANLYVVLLARSSSYFRACQQGTGCLTAVLGSSFCK
jgi:hypothetical protein